MSVCSSNSSSDIEDNKEIVLADNKEIVLAAVTQNGRALAFASAEFKDDVDVVLAAVRQDAWALSYASERLKNDMDIVTEAVKQNGKMLTVAGGDLRRNKSVVLAAVKSRPDALKYARGALKRDSDCLIAAGMWDEDFSARLVQKTTTIALSTRFSLTRYNTYEATNFTALFKKHNFIRDGDFQVYSPNAFDKATCDPSGEYT